MAREESDREDLMREATALVERVELIVAGYAEPIVAGFRRNAALSMFFGAEPVYQFNPQGELRRAFRSGTLIKANDSKLFELHRQRTESEVLLVRREFDSFETKTFLQEMRGHLCALQSALDAGEIEISGKVPAETDVVKRLIPVLAKIVANPVIAQAPNAN